MSWVYVQSERGGERWVDGTGREHVTTDLFTVGHYGPDGKFIPESDHGTAALAGARCHWLNGGQPTEPPQGGTVAREPSQPGSLVTVRSLDESVWAEVFLAGWPREHFTRNDGLSETVREALLAVFTDLWEHFPVEAFFEWEA